MRRCQDSNLESFRSLETKNDGFYLFFLTKEEKNSDSYKNETDRMKYMYIKEKKRKEKKKRKRKNVILPGLKPGIFSKLGD